MYRSGAAAQRLLAITPLVQTEKFSSWLSRGSLSPELLRSVSAVSPVRGLSAAPPPPEPELARQESHLSGSSWSYVPKSVHASWDAYFRGGTYQAPPSLGDSSKPNEVSLASMMPGLVAGGGGQALAGGGQASSAVIDAHLAVQGTIRSYQVRGHLAAQIDPLGLNNMDREQARKMIIRSVTVDEKDL